ncbi:MAG: bifunctional phosphoribosylaminoimidazolecarboxamide formyltransferase/IMP cyclohydrolase [Caldisericia bacterium]|nr:bifunctional phosphoribosylaminoimidazolecarboxamide formyltransferase/IMP cyclohydrolase [Caldisericia bacterium]
MIKIKNALISVSDKSNLLDLAEVLTQNRVKIFATGSTYKNITDGGFTCNKVSEYTNFPEIINGRVKTLHPKVFGGILSRTRTNGEIEETESYDIIKFDLVCVNLYPFSKKATETNNTELLLDNIDIGGVALLRASAKNFLECVTLSNPDQYLEFINTLQENNGHIPVKTSKQLMKKSFLLTSMYDASIVKKFTEEDNQIQSIYMSKNISLRYGENPHQSASFWTPIDKPNCIEPILPLGCKKIHGKELSYNNILDTGIGLDLIDEFKDVPTSVILKHTSPCGAASSSTIEDAYKKAFAGDPISAFGGIFIFNKEVTAPIAEHINSVFVEIVCSPSYSEEALKILTKKKNIRILKRIKHNSLDLRIRDAGNGFLIQDKDKELFSKIEVITEETLSESDTADIIFGLQTLKYVKSNAILVCKNRQILGIGGGQPNRIDSTRISLSHAKERFGDLTGSVLCSDAYFPFADSIQEASKYGIRIVVEPGGSIKDKLVIEEAKKLGVILVFTGQRHFLH